MKDVRKENWREKEISFKEGKSVFDTEMLKGAAEDSLHGKNVLKQYECENPPTEHGGENAGK